MKNKRQKKQGPGRKTPGRNAEQHLGATEEQVGDRTGSGAGYDQKDKSKKKPAKGGVST
jgi:hypothetical protein